SISEGAFFSGKAPSLPLKTLQKEMPLPPSKTFCAYQKPARSFPAQTAFGARPSKKEDRFNHPLLY
ncbi:hypothetical protein, partial [Bilophila wadsworthia]|uniref:hypothetical protein n=1 Tax=Bilophila wadsworthia TaxID=35833 RepID=UPI003AB87541